MKRFTPYLSWLAVVLVMVPVIWPFISRDSLPVATDAELHVFRMAELERLIRGGEFYPRWAPNFYFGYGYPIFNYYSPFVYYFGVFIAFLPRVGPVEATKAVFVLGLLLGALGSFGFVRDRWGTAAGIGAAVLFGTAPYIQFIDPHSRGVLAESFALGMLPVCLCLFGRLLLTGRKRYFVLGALSLTIFVLSHNLMAMVGSGLLLVWLLWHWWWDAAENQGRFSLAHLAPLLSFSCGIGMSFFFWLPVALERNLVNLNTLVGEDGSHFSWSSHFLSFGDFFALSNLIDWGATQSTFQFNLGLVQAVLLLALVVWVGAKLAQKRHVEDREQLFWLLMSLAVLFFTLPVSAFFWRTVPVLPFIQFPWRFLGPAAIALAIGGGSLLKDWRLSGGVTAVALLLALPLMQVTPWGEFGPTDLAAVAFQEQKGRWLGTTSTADFIPATALVDPKPVVDLLDDLGANQTPDRVNRYSLPQSAEVVQEEISPLHFQYQVSADEEFTLRFFIYEFPGWHVEVDGVPVDHEIGFPEGFIVVPLSAGEHTVDVEFGATPARTAGWTVSALALFLLVSIACFLQAQPKSDGNKLAQIAPIPPMALGGLALLVVIVLLIPGRWVRYESADGVVEPAEFQLNVSLDRQIELLAYDINKTDARPGEWIELDLYWMAEVEPDIDFQVFVHLLDANGNLVAQSDKLNPGDFPTRRWTTDKYVTDRHLLQLPQSLAAGDYQITAGLWVMNEGWRLPVLAADGTTSGDVVIIDQIKVTDS